VQVLRIEISVLSQLPPERACTHINTHTHTQRCTECNNNLSSHSFDVTCILTAHANRRTFYAKVSRCFESMNRSVADERNETGQAKITPIHNSARNRSWRAEKKISKISSSTVRENAQKTTLALHNEIGQFKLLWRRQLSTEFRPDRLNWLHLTETVIPQTNSDALRVDFFGGKMQEFSLGKNSRN
jgi:hypothetical protein